MTWRFRSTLLPLDQFDHYPQTQLQFPPTQVHYNEPPHDKTNKIPPITIPNHLLYLRPGYCLDDAVNRGHKQTDVHVMDFAKTFDKVPHRRLLYKG